MADLMNINSEGESIVMGLQFGWYSVSEHYIDPYERETLTIGFTLPTNLKEDFQREVTDISGKMSETKLRKWIETHLHELISQDCITRADSPTSCSINSVADLSDHLAEMQFSY